MHHYGDNVMGSIYMRFSGNVPALTPVAGEENIRGVWSFRCIMNSFRHHKADSLQPTFHIKQFKTI